MRVEPASESPQPAAASVAVLQMKDVRVNLDRLGPELEKLKPGLEKMRLELPRLLDNLRAPNVRVRFDADAGKVDRLPMATDYTVTIPAGATVASPPTRPHWPSSK